MARATAAPPYRRQFEELAGFAMPSRRVNRPQDRLTRADALFELLARSIFERPSLGRALARRLPRWLALEPNSEELWALAGYVFYCLRSYRQAERAFLRAIALAPDNLDDWLDLAMTLRHLGHPLGARLILEHDRFMAAYRRTRTGRLDRPVLSRLSRLLAAQEAG
ncbi:MAG: hypothetical protein KGO96_03745 [Elusimicrobia bacterium]|nr:hypothetical protein [Elusimicrobiota bacterium]MDE2236689.1 hypothetical protein [Elusimicrobiota bacterium]MDE2425006.1 hypothetical protein [Elusimicrobiota bacterium]